MTTNSYCTSNHILVGLGGTGGKILKAFKMRMFEEFPTQEERSKQPVALLYVDSTDEMMSKDGRARADFRVMGQDASFTNNEFLNIKAVDVEHILDHIDHYPSVKGIVQNVGAVKTAIGALGQAAGQKRRAGRLLFAANAVGYVNSLKDAYSRCINVSGDSSQTTIHIFAGLSGGTGSGSIVDAIIQTRKAFPGAYISVYAMMPEMNLPKSDMDQGRYYQNGYAALNELNALQAGAWKPQDVTGGGEADYYSDRVKGVANGLTIYSNVNENGLTINSFSELPKVISDFIFARIFFVNDQDEVNSDIVRAYKYENMDDFALEYDEAGNPDPVTGRIPVARTKKVNSIGIKRVMYPELRVLKHITYTIGESVLYQFKYNNWRENQGFANEERNRDYRNDFINKENLSNWMLDEEHLTLEKKILPNDNDFMAFNEYWHDKAINYAQDAKKADCPLNELDNIMGDSYANFFRDCGVENYYAGKEKAIPDMAREIRHTVEKGFFEKWKDGDISITELQKISKLLIERVGEIRTELEGVSKDEQEEYKAIDEDRKQNLKEWSDLGILQRMVNVGERKYARHQEYLTEFYTSKTRIVALEFAKKLAAKVFNELGKMDADISAFGMKINEAINETERLVTAQRKVNKGLEDMKGAIIEVSEDETMSEFEQELKTDKIEMPIISRQLRDCILPEEFVNFGRLAADISIDDITDAFDIKLSEIVKARHDEKADSDKKVLGLNILTQLQQKLRTDDDIKAFATKIVSQSGVFIKLNTDQIQLHLRNNEGNLSPTNPASINKKAILVSIPSPDDNPGLKKFADKLEAAFKNSFNQSTARTSITVNRKSLRKDELSIITVQYCFPIRAIDWMGDYKKRYERFLNSGNLATDMANAILLHSEGDGKQLPSLFAKSDEEINAAEAAFRAQQAAATQTVQPTQAFGQTAATQPFGQPMQAQPVAPQPFGQPAPQPALQAMAQPQVGQPPIAQPAQQAVVPPVQQPGAAIPPPIPGAVPPPIMPPADPVIALHMNVGGQAYGPYDWQTCKQFTTTKQLTEQTMVWMQGMPSWLPAGQVDVLKPLFAPAPPPMTPPMPGGATPPPMPC